MFIIGANSKELFDHAITLTCPHCNSKTNLTLISPPDFASLVRYLPNHVGMAYKCNACHKPIFLKFIQIRYELQASRIFIGNEYEEIEHPLETFDFQYIPEPAQSDFKEALICYSNGAYNAFAAMCRRTIQSSATLIGAKGKDRVYIMEIVTTLFRAKLTQGLADFWVAANAIKACTKIVI
jgi:DNA-directed RNA polymerase subunit RPC12/RpoP